MQQNDTHTNGQGKKNFSQENVANFNKKILVMSNKGGVGKSTVSVNLSYALALNKGKRVGILDADIHGPSINKMLGISEKKLLLNENGNPGPIRVHDNFFALSTAVFIEKEDSPVIFRGPMKMKLISQFIEDIQWPSLDYLIIDSSPGTGDEPLSIIQLLNGIDYAVIVTTPQEVAQLDAQKGINFLKQLGVMKIGIIENMAALVCPHCHTQIQLFNNGNTEDFSKKYNVRFLGSIPFEPEIGIASDNGRPYVYDYNKRASAEKITAIAEKIEQELITVRMDTVSG